MNVRYVTKDLNITSLTESTNSKNMIEEVHTRLHAIKDATNIILKRKIANEITLLLNVKEPISTFMLTFSYEEKMSKIINLIT